ncbi:MAG: hypothetical protein ACPGSC_04040 [Granulosicoccaceae bacterium]
MSETAPPASIDAPFLATSAEEIEQLLSVSKRPLDTMCGLLATDPALLVHLLRKLTADSDTALDDYSLRHLAGCWLQAPDHRWYAKLLAVRHSALSEHQRTEHRALCVRAAIAAGLVGEWSCDDVPSLRGAAELAETRAVVAVLPSLLQLCRIQHGACYESVGAEREAWMHEVSTVLGEPQAKALYTPESPDDPANIAVEIAASAVSSHSEEKIQLKLPEWSRRLNRDAELIAQDIARVNNGLAMMEGSHAQLNSEQVLSLIQGRSPHQLERHDCENCRQQQFDNALATIRLRLGQGDFAVTELIDHLLFAICNCGSLRRAQWLHLDSERQALQSRRRKLAPQASKLAAWDLSISDLPMLQVLLERPRSIQVYPEIREQLVKLLPHDAKGSFAEHYLCASVFCGSVPLGVVYADADGETLGAAEAAKFKAVVQLASKMVTLLALRNRRFAATPDVSQLAYPDYASFDLNRAANEQSTWRSDTVKHGLNSL